MQRNIVETILGAVVLLIAGGFVFFFYRTTDIHPATGYEISAEFSNVSGLEAGSPVRIAGVKVGQVLGFALDKKAYRAIVHMNIDTDVDLPLDTSAVITSAGLLDGKFMTLQPGGDEDNIKPGGKIGFTQASPSLEELLGKFIFSTGKSNDGGGGSEDAAPEETTHEEVTPAETAPEETPSEETLP